MVQKETVPILDIPIARLSLSEVISDCLSLVERSLGGYVCFANAHSVTESTQNAALKDALSHATYSVADGLPLVWVSRVLRQPIRSRVCGPDFMATLIQRRPEMSYGFIGGKPGQSEALASRFGLKAVCSSPPMRPFSPAGVREDLEVFRARCPDGKFPNFIWVGLGAPKQELWIAEASKHVPQSIFFGVGAAFDFLTDTKKRAPLWMQKSGLEWLYRLIQEPGRLWKRYFVTNSLFILKVTGQVLRGRLGSDNLNT